MRKWFWLAVLSGDRLRWPRWIKTLLLLMLTAFIVAGVIYAFVVFNAVSERSEQHHVNAHSTH